MAPFPSRNALGGGDPTADRDHPPQHDDIAAMESGARPADGGRPSSNVLRVQAWAGGAGNDGGGGGSKVVPAG